MMATATTRRCGNVHIFLAACLLLSTTLNFVLLMERANGSISHTNTDDRSELIMPSMPQQKGLPLYSTINNTVSSQISPAATHPTNRTDPRIRRSISTKNKQQDGDLSTLPARIDHGSKLTVVILTMNRWTSLQRLLNSLRMSHYAVDDQIDLIIRVDRPKEETPDWQIMVEQIRTNFTWTQGEYRSFIYPQNVGLRRAWIDAWQPGSDTDRAIIFEDDVEVSPYWYVWLKGAYAAYENRTDLAGIALQRQWLVPSLEKRSTNKVSMNRHVPFLYKMVASIGFAPMAKPWRHFVEFANCAIATEVAVSTPALITSGWYEKMRDKASMWTQLFVYFCMHNTQLYTLYLFPKKQRALAAHWKEKGEHHDGHSRGRDFRLAREEDILMQFPTKLNAYNWGADLVESADEDIVDQRPSLQGITLCESGKTTLT